MYGPGLSVRTYARCGRQSEVWLYPSTVASAVVCHKLLWAPAELHPVPASLEHRTHKNALLPHRVVPHRVEALGTASHCWRGQQRSSCCLEQRSASLSGCSQGHYNAALCRGIMLTPPVPCVILLSTILLEMLRLAGECSCKFRQQQHLAAGLRLGKLNSAYPPHCLHFCCSHFNIACGVGRLVACCIFSVLCAAFSAD